MSRNLHQGLSGRSKIGRGVLQYLAAALLVAVPLYWGIPEARSQESGPVVAEEPADTAVPEVVPESEPAAPAGSQPAAPPTAQPKASRPKPSGPPQLQIHPEAVRLRAEVLLAEGQYNTAGKLLQAYLRSNPDDGDAWLLQARVFRNIKQYKLVFKALDRAGERPGVHLVAARTYFEMGQADKALSEIRESVSRYPDLGDAHHFLGYLYATQKQYEQAVQSLKTALEKKTTKRVATYFYLGQSLYELKRYDEAEQYLRMAQREGGETDYAKPTEDFLDLILLRKQQLTKVSEKPKPSGAEVKPWRGYAQLLIEYDSNTTLLPDVENVPGLKAKKGVRNVLAAGMDGRIYKNKDWRIRGNADLTYAYDYRVDESQLLAVQGGMYAPKGILLGKYQGSLTPYFLSRLILYGDYGDGDLDGDKSPDALQFSIEDPFSIDIEGGLRFVWQQDETAAMAVGLGYYYSMYTDETGGGSAPQSLRDGNNINLGVTQSVILSAVSTKDLTINGQLKGGYRNSKCSDYSYWTIEGGGGADWKAMDLLYLTAATRVRYERYFDSPMPCLVNGSPQPSPYPETRWDTTVTGDLAARYRLLKTTDVRWWAVLRMLYEHNFSAIDSVPKLTYDKLVISFGFRAEF